MKFRFDTSCDAGRIEEGEEIEPIEGAVAAICQGATRPTFHLMESGNVTLISKAGVRIPLFGTNGEVID